MTKKRKGLIIFAVLFVLGGIGSLINSGKGSPEPAAPVAETAPAVESESPETETETPPAPEVEPAADVGFIGDKASLDVSDLKTPDNIVGVSDKNIDDLDLLFNKSVHGDKTGHWRGVVVAKNNIDMVDYVLSAYDKYFDDDCTVLAIHNLITKTATSITDIGSCLDVNIYEYVDKEENDAVKMFSGMRYAHYWVYFDGDVEKITEE